MNIFTLLLCTILDEYLFVYFWDMLLGNDTAFYFIFFYFLVSGMHTSGAGREGFGFER